MKNKISAYLSHLQGLSAAGKIDCLIVVDVQRNPEGEPVPTVGAFAEDIEQGAAARLVEHMRGIGKELREGLAAGGGAYPPPPPPPKPLEPYFNGRVLTRTEEID